MEPNAANPEHRADEANAVVEFGKELGTVGVDVVAGDAIGGLAGDVLGGAVDAFGAVFDVLGAILDL